MFPRHLRHRLPRTPCGRAQPGALLSLQPPKLCQPPDGIPLQITGCCLRFPFLPIKAALLALECSLGTPVCAFLIPPPRASDSACLEAASTLLFPSSVGWLGFCYSWSWPPMSNLGVYGYLPFEGLDWELKVQPVLLKISISLVLFESSSDLPRPCPWPHHHCGNVLSCPDGRYIE